MVEKVAQKTLSHTRTADKSIHCSKCMRWIVLSICCSQFFTFNVIVVLSLCVCIFTVHCFLRTDECIRHKWRLRNKSEVEKEKKNIWNTNECGSLVVFQNFGFLFASCSEHAQSFVAKISHIAGTCARAHCRYVSSSDSQSVLIKVFNCKWE